MQNISKTSSFILGSFFLVSLFLFGYLLSNAIVKYKELDRTVVVKGLSEKEVLADVAIVPIKIIQSNNKQDMLIDTINSDTNIVLDFLKEYGIKDEEITISSISVVDKMANEYSNSEFPIRYFASKTINIYSSNIEKIKNLSSSLSALAQKGVLYKVDDYDTKIEYIYTKLNDIKPSMIEEATQNARLVANKFAKDSNSTLGKIKKASQGQFEIYSIDKNNEHIKKIRVVSTIEYYLVD